MVRPRGSALAARMSVQAVNQSPDRLASATQASLSPETARTRNRLTLQTTEILYLGLPSPPITEQYLLFRDITGKGLPRNPRVAGFTGKQAPGGLKFPRMNHPQPARGPLFPAASGAFHQWPPPPGLGLQCKYPVE